MVQSSSMAEHLLMPSPSPRHAQNPALVAFGKAVKRARRRAGLNQEELAHLSGADRSYVSSIERGGQNPGLMTVLGLASALGMSLAELSADAKL